MAGFATELAVGVALLIAAIWAVQQAFFTIRYPSNLPRIGGSLKFSLKTRWRYHTDARELYKEVYQNYSKKGKSVLVPGVGFHDDLILPPSAMRWLLRQPEHMVGAFAAQGETIQSFYSLGHSKFVQDPWAALLVKTDLNAVLENVCAAMNDELSLAIDSHFGTDTKVWKDIDLLSTIRMIVAQASSRFTLGDSPLGRVLCRNRGYLKACLDMADALVVNAAVAGGSPKMLRPILGRLGGLAAKRQSKVVEKYFAPVYQERMRLVEEIAADPSIREPEDHLQIMFRFGMKERRDEIQSVQDMTKRICVTNFGSMHQASIQIVNMLLDILDSDPEFNTISILRDEVARIRGKEKEVVWNKGIVASLTRIDSVARETLRLHALSSRSVLRLIMKDGLVTEDGIALPKGSMVSFMSYWTLTDGDAFEDPFKYDPFRFSRAREAEVDEQGKPGLANLRFTSTGLGNLAFGHGKHACPGRFLVDFEIKMVTAYVLLNYDIEFPPEYNGKRPQNNWFAEACLLPHDVKMKVRRRERAE